MADIVKPTSQAAIKEFEAMGIEVVMLTGDNKSTAQAIRKQLELRELLLKYCRRIKKKKSGKFRSRADRLQ